MGTLKVFSEETMVVKSQLERFKIEYEDTDSWLKYKKSIKRLMKYNVKR